MELKSYDKSWLPAFKGAFLILFGIIAMLQILGTMKTLAVFFVALIGMMAILLIRHQYSLQKIQFQGLDPFFGPAQPGFCHKSCYPSGISGKSNFMDHVILGDLLCPE